MTQPLPVDVVAETVKKSFIAHEPAMVAAAVAWLLTNVGLIVVGHTHAVTAEQWTAVATYLTPIISAVVFALIGVVLRKFVTPAWKWAEIHVLPVLDGTDEDTLPPLK